VNKENHQDRTQVKNILGKRKNNRGRKETLRVLQSNNLLKKELHIKI